MGCWNGTCMLSNLPIIHGQKVKFVVLVKNKYSDSSFELNGCCYPTDELKVLSPVLTGEYNDYGAVEHLDEDSTKFIKELTKDLRITPDDCYSKEEIDTINAIERGFVQYNGNKVSFVMFHEDVYNAIIKPKLISWRDKEIPDKDFLKWFNVESSGRRLQNLFKEFNDTRYLEVSKLCHILACARMRFYLPSGSGSQDDDMKFQKIIADATIKFKKPTYD